MKAYYWMLAVLSVFAVIGLTAQGLIIVLLISIIGIPLAFILLLAPAVATILLPAAVLQGTVLRAIPGLRGREQGGLGVFLSIGIALALNAGLALWTRQSDLAHLQGLLAEDRSPDTPPQIAGSVGVVVDGDPYGLGLYECPDLCQRLLLTGLADRVVLADARGVAEVPAPDQYATIWRMERRAVCPAVGLNTNTGTLAVPGEPERAVGSIRPVDLMNLEMAAGNCLIREEATYGRPDFTLLDVDVSRFPVRGRRAALIRHDGDKDVLMARQTVAKANVVGPLYVPLPEPSMTGPSSVGLWRQPVLPQGGPPAGADFASFLTGVLGLNLALVTESSAATLRDQVSAVLGQPGPVPDSAEPLIASFLQSFAFGTMTDAADQAVLLDILARPEVSLPWWTATGLPPFAPEHAEFYGKVADLTFARLPLPEREFSTGEAIDNLLDRLPPEVIKPRSDTVLRLAADPAVRFLNSRILALLSEVGPDAGPVLIKVLAEPVFEGNSDLAYFIGEAWRDQQTWSFVALCRGGPVFAGLKPDLQALIETETVNARSLIALKALLRIGFARSELEVLLSANGSDLAQDLDRAIRDVASAEC